MDSKQRLLIASVGLIGFLIGSMALVWVLLPEQQAPSIVVPVVPTPPPEVHLYKKFGGLTLEWHNLPEGTARIIIYRAKRGTEKWDQWKVIEITPAMRAGGSFSIETKDNLSNYTFYTEAIQITPGGGSGTSTGTGTGPGQIVLWQSSSTLIEIPPAPPITTTGGSTSTTQTTSTQPADTDPTPPAQTSTTSGQPPAPTSTVYQQPGVYYTPEGQIVATSGVSHADFWVDHVNRNIEIGWQRLPAGTKTVVVYRATSESGPWDELIRQTTPTDPYSIRLIDNSIYTAHWYRMEAIGNGVTQTYGPLELPALAAQ